MSEPLITVADLSDYLGEDVDNADFACDAASAIIRSYLDNYLTLQEDVIERLDGSGTDALVLPKPPVRAVTTVTECEVDLTVEDDYWLGNAGILFRTVGRWPFGRGNVLVTYDRGYDLTTSYPGSDMALPEDIVAVALALAKRLSASGALPVGGYTGETIGEYAYTRSVDATGIYALDIGERAVLDHYLSRRVA